MSKQASPLLRIFLCGLLLSVCAPAGVALAQLDQSCVVSILNRTVQVSPQGGWSMPNVPSNMGKVRARATCVQNGQTISGESDYFAVTTNGIVQVGEIKFGSLDPIPVSLSFTQQGTTTLTSVGATYQIGLRATYADGTVKDITQASSGANYSSTNPTVASVSPDGLVSAVSSGTVLLTARKDEVVAIKEVVVNVGGDSDGDGLPDNYELARGLNPKDPIDAQEDVDNDNLTALREFQLGTDPRARDTDADGISDGDEVAAANGFATSPLLPDTDGDGLSDRIELLAGSNPLDPADKNFAGALDRITVTPSALALTFNTVNSEASAQLTVTGVLIDGSTVNLTRKSSGTTYNSSSLSVASFGLTDGEIFAGQPGSATITIANSGKQATVPVVVESFQPVALSAIPIPGYANNVDVAGDFAFVAAGAAGLQVVDVADHAKPTIAASLDTDGTAIDVRVFGNYAYLADGESGLKIINVQNPRAPQLVTSVDTAGIAQDVKVDRQIAYVADGAKGLVIIDVANPAAPVVKSELGGIGDAQGVDAFGGRAVVAAGNSLLVLDVSNPAAPLVVGNLGVGDVKDVVIDGDYAYLAVYGTGYRIVDISTPAAPVVVGGDARIAPRDVELTDDFAFFAEQLFPNVAAYVNVQDPANPLFQGVIDLSRLGDYAGTGIAVDGSYVYVTEESYVVRSDYEASGNTKLFIAQYRMINDKAGIPPTVSITRPLANSSVVEGTTISVDVAAGDDVGVRSVSFAVDGQTVFTDSTQPYQIPIAIPFGKTGARVTATATDFGSNTASDEITLRVLADTDRDALGDEQETLVYGTDVNDPDTDSDGLKDGAEVALGTNPLNGDTDGDGRSDRAEVDADTDPLNPDVTPPTVTLTSPVPGTTGVPENQPVTVTFSEKLRPSSVKFGSISLTHNGAVAPGSVQLLAGGTQAAFMPTGLLDDFSEYEVTISGIRDVAGNLLEAPVMFTYTTGNVVDTEPPQIVTSNPATGDTDVPVNTAVVVILNEPVDPLTVTDDTFYVRDSVGLVGGTGSLADDGRTLAFVPNAALSVKRSHTIYVTGVKDLFGNQMSRTVSFTTGFTADSTAPKFVASSLQNGATGVPTNAVMSVSFDEPISALSLGDIELRQGTDPLPVTRQFNADHSVVTLKFGQPLQPNTTYSIVVSGVEDLSGNVLAAGRTVSFTTGTGLDQTAPVLLGRTPISSATGVPLNTLIEVQYNEPLNPTLLSETAARLYDGQTGQFLPGTASLSQDGTAVRFASTAQLQPDRTYSLYVSYYAQLQDLAGNNAPGNTTSFTTGSTAQNGPPQVVLSSLADGVSGVPVNGRLVLQFDTPLMDRCVTAQTLQVSSAGAPVAGVLALSTDRRQLTFTPSAALAVSTTYTMALNGLCDLAGNVLTGVTRSFTTAASATPDTTAPTVTVSPANNATGVPATAAVTFTFNEAIDVTTLAGAIQVSVSGLSGEVAGQLAINGNVATFTSVEPFPGNTRINVSVSSVRDLAGNARSVSTFFTTGAAADVTAPRIVSITPNDKAVDVGPNTPIVLTFSESLNSRTVTNSNIALFVNGAVVRPSVSRSTDNRTVILTATLPAASVVSVIVGDEVQDLSGNALADFASVFTTAVAADTTRPSVVRQFPGSGASGVLPDASIALFSSERMNEGSLPSALHVAQNGQLVTGTLSVGANSQVITFRPLQPWAPNALVEVYLDSNARDVGGNALVNYQGQFRIAVDPLATLPQTIATSDTSNLPTNAVIDLGFNQTLNPATVSSATVNLLAIYNASTPLPATVSLLKGGRVVRLVPQSTLAPNTTYYVRVNGTVADTDGQSNQTICCYSFTTAAGALADNVAPKLLAMNPPNGSTGVGVNGYVHARFDESMNTLSLWPEQPQTQYESLFWSSSNTITEFMPHAPYAANTQVTESVAGVQDRAGNPVTPPNSVTFTTGPGADFTTPQILDSNPYNGATNVPVNAPLRVHLSESLDPVSVNANSAYLYSSVGGTVGAAVTLEPDGRTLTYVPTQALAVNRNYTLYAYGVQDLAGNASYLASGFKTGLSADGQSPVVTGTSIANGLADLPTNALLSVAFDEPINDQKLAGITLTQGGSPVPARAVVSSDHQTVTLRPQQLLQSHTAYVLSVAGVEDLSGNALASGRTVSFTTGGGLDLVGPTILGRVPVSGASDVPLNTLIEVQYSERLNPLLLQEPAARLYDSATGDFLPGTSSLSPDGTVVRFVPSDSLEPSHAYGVYVSYYDSLQDLAGNNATSNTTSFTTGTAPHTSAPQLVLSSLADGVSGVPVNGRVVLQFDTALLDRCVTAQTLQVSSGGVSVAGALSLSSDRRQLTFTPSAALGTSTTYTVALNGLCDLAGNILSGVTRSFTTSATATADTTAPTVTISPTNGATGVPATTAVTFTFNEAIDVTTLAGAIQVSVQSLSGEVAGELAVNGSVVTFTSLEALPGNTRINVSVSNVRDLAGNARSASTFFTTGAAADVTAPRLLTITPNDKAVDVGPGTPIVLTFSESLNSTTVTNTNIALFVNGAVVRPSVSRSSDNRTVILTATLPAASVVSVIVGDEVKDLSGNGLADFASVFTTAAAADTSRPSIVRQFPGSGASDVLSDASIVLFANEPLNESTLPSALHVAQNGQLVTGTLSTGSNGQTIVFRPVQPWAPDALIELYLDSDVLDAAGNSLNGYQGQFRTAVNSQTVLPSVVAISDTSGLPTNAIIDLGFNQTLNPATVSATTVNLLASNNTLLPATVSLIKAGRVVRLAPQSALIPNTTYRVRINAGLADTDGQSNQTICCYNFTTAVGAIVDNVAPKVVAMNPPNGSTGVGVNGYVHARFDESMNTLSLWPAQQQTLYESVFWSDSNTSASFMPHAPYAANSQVTESVAAAQDRAGNGVTPPNSATFTTGPGGDFTTPKLADGTPYNGATNVPVNAVIRLRFNEPLDPASLHSDVVYLYASGVVPGTVTLEPDGRTLTYVPAQALDVSRSYSVYAYGVQDLAGNLSYIASSFTTGAAADSSPPLVTGTSIVNGLSGVPTNAVLSVTFDESINEQKLSGITLSQSGSAVQMQPVVSGDHRTVTLKLQQLLLLQTPYVFTISGVEDLSGNVLAASSTVSFTTGGGLDLVPPALVSRTPANAATGVPLNTALAVQYGERLAPLSLQDTARLIDNSIGQAVPGTQSLSPDGTTLQFTPSAPLQPNRTYNFYVSYYSSLEDLAGNNAPAVITSFTTGAQ